MGQYRPILCQRIWDQIILLEEPLMLQITLYAYSEFTLDMSILLAVLQVAILSQHSLQPIDILTIVAI